MKYVLILISVLFCFSSCTVSRYPQKGKLVWKENFNQKETFDSTRWTKIPRGSSDWDRYMSSYDSLFEMRKGKLVLRGISNTTQKQDTARFLTGGVYTRNKVSFGSGRIEIRAKLGGATGAWPAFWLLGQGVPYPEGGEIDIIEHLNYDTFVYQTVHSDYTIKLNQKENPPHGGKGAIRPDKFNTYAVEKYKDSVVFYVNNKRTFAYPRIETQLKGQFPFADLEHYLMLDMQLSGSWVGNVKEDELPIEMKIDWVRYYKF